MVIIMKFFATNQDADGKNVGASVWTCEVAIAKVVANAVDHACSPKRDPGHLDCPNCEADRTKQSHVNNQHQNDATGAETRVNVTLEPIIGRTVTELGERLCIVGLMAIELGAAE